MTIELLLQRAERYLARRGVHEAGANAEFLLASVLDIGRVEIKLKRHRTPPARKRRRFWNWIIRRGRRVPLAYILGTQPFNGFELKVRPGVLIPRPETEELAQMAIDAGRKLEAGGRRPLRILDIGTGSGCIAMALARALPKAEITAIDVSRKAIELAKTNARSMGIHARIKFLLIEPAELPHLVIPGEKTDLIVSNPPYIPSRRLQTLEPEVLREPRLALDGGPDGLKIIRQVISLSARILRPQGRFVLEMDAHQGKRVRNLLSQSGFDSIEIRRDYQSMDRFATAIFPSA